MRDLIEALQFLTIFRLKKNKSSGQSALFASSAACFPFVGAFLGTLLVIAQNLLSLILPPLILSTLLIGLFAVVTRALHLDGLADTCDALGGAEDRERRLAIMRDSHIGTFGVIALIFVLVFQILVLSSLASSYRNLGLVLMTLLSRYSLNIGIAFFPYARDTGKASIFFENKERGTFWLATLSTVVLLGFSLTAHLFVTNASLPGHGCTAATLAGMGTGVFLLVCLLTALIDRGVYNMFGGLTGDTLGAVCAANECAVLLSLFIFTRTPWLPGC